MLYEILGFSDYEFPAGLGWHDKIVSGFHKKSLWALAQPLGVRATDLADLVGLSESELDRSKRDQLLSPQVSNRLFNIGRAYQRLMVPLKDAEQAQGWLRNSQPCLGNRIPVLLLMTQPGACEVLAAIDALKVQKTVEMNPLYEELLANHGSTGGDDGPRGLDDEGPPVDSEDPVEVY